MERGFYPDLLPQPANNEHYNNGDVAYSPISVNPHNYGEYDGPLNEIHGTVIHVGVNIKDNHATEVTHAIRLLSVDNPYLKENPPKLGQKSLTVIMFGGGTSDALVSFDVAAKIFDGDNASSRIGDFRIANFVSISHPDGSARTDKYTDSTEGNNGLSTSGDLAYIALQTAREAQAVHISTDGTMELGFSAGGQMATELSQRLGSECKALVLVEPTGIANFPHLAIEFIVGNFLSPFQEEWRKGYRGFTRLKRGYKGILDSWGTPYGSYNGLGHILATLTKPTSLLFNQDARDIQYIGHQFGIEKPILPVAGNLNALSHDTTQSSRQTVTAPVTLVNVLDAHITNLLNAEGITKRELRQASRDIDSIKIKNPNPILDENAIRNQSLLEKIKDRALKSLKNKSPNASKREFILWQGKLHAGPLLTLSFFTRLFHEMKTNQMVLTD